MIKKITLLFLLILFPLNLKLKSENIIFSDNIIKYIYSNNDWNEINKSIGQKILSSEGIRANIILFKRNKHFENFFMYLTKDITDLYFSTENFIQNTLKRGRYYYSLDKKWGYSYMINLNGNRKAAVTIGRSGTYTSNNFPSNTVIIWVEYLTPLINKKTNESNFIFYGLTFRLPIKTWENLKNSFFQKYIFNKLFIQNIQYIETTPEVLEALKWLKKNNFKISHQSKVLENIKPKEKIVKTVNTQIEFHKLSLSEKTNAKWFAPNDVIKGYIKDGKNVQSGLFKYDYTVNTFNIGKNMLTYLRDIKNIKIGKKEKLFRTVHYIEFLKTNQKSIRIFFKDIEKIGGYKFLYDYIQKIRKINSIVYKHNIDLL